MKFKKLAGETSNSPAIHQDFYETKILVETGLVRPYRVCLENNQSSDVEFWDFTNLEKAQEFYNSMELKN